MANALRAPMGIYGNWSAYDELSDSVELTEDLAMRQFSEMLRLRGLGARLECYMMDAFWFAPDGGYLEWRKPHWPDGPDRWLAACSRAGITPGLWLSVNSLVKLECVEAWQTSLSRDRGSLCLFDGDYAAALERALDHWARRGVGLFKFDFLNLDAATPEAERRMLPSEIRAANIRAWRAIVHRLRQAHPEAVLLMYNGVEELPSQSCTDFPLRKVIDPAWLESFDAVYCGDPRPSDVPMLDFWRSVDLYSDHMVRYYMANGLPAHPIDNSAFMMGLTGTCCRRGKAGWKSMLLRSLARGGWANTYYGNLELLGDGDGQWFAQAQRLFFPLQAGGTLRVLGPMPGEGRPYAFDWRAAEDRYGVALVVNPGQERASVQLDGDAGWRALWWQGSVPPSVEGGSASLAPEQAALVGWGGLPGDALELGSTPEDRVPARTQRCQLETVRAFAGGEARFRAVPVAGASMRVLVKQLGADGRGVRTASSPPAGELLDRFLTIVATQDGRPLPIQIGYGKAIWSGLSWASAEIEAGAIGAGPIEIAFGTEDARASSIDASAWTVWY